MVNSWVRMVNFSGTVDERIFVLILDPGEEAVATITGFAKETAASLTALGALSHATVGWFDLGSKKYRRIAVE